MTILSSGNHFLLIFHVLTSCFFWPPAASFWFFSCRHGNGGGDVGDVCSFLCRCRAPNTCEAGVQRCVSPGKLHDPCHITRPCGKGLSCHPGIQKCYHVPRRLYEPCVVGFQCGSGLTCHPGIQVCYHSVRRYNEPCVVGFPCGTGLSCQPGSQRCLHFPRREGERCSLGFECGPGLECKLCDKPYLTCEMTKLPNMDDEFYSRPYNKVAFLVTHNAFSNSEKYAFWVRNQRVSVSQQLKDGVRGLMLDIYPGWGSVEVQLCHGNCFWGGSSDLLDTLIEIRHFLENNPREVITIIFEDYLRNPTILKRVFHKAQLSSHVLPNNQWGTRYKPWPTLTDMRSLGRVVVLNNIGIDEFPYNRLDMWYDVRENRYGQQGLDTKTCKDRGESRFNADMNTYWSLVLVNWFGTVPNPFNLCLNSFKKIQQKLHICQQSFGQRANFLAVDYYQNGQDGGAFKAVQKLNQQWKDEFQEENRIKPLGINIVTTNLASSYLTETSANKNINNHTTLSLNVTRHVEGDKRSHVIHDATNKTQNHVTSMTRHLSSTNDHVTNTSRRLINKTSDSENHGMTKDNDVTGQLINSTNRIDETVPGLNEVFNNIHDSDDDDDDKGSGNGDGNGDDDEHDGDENNKNDDDNQDENDSDDTKSQTHSKNPTVDKATISANTNSITNSTLTNVTYMSSQSSGMALSSDTSNNKRNITHLMKNAKHTSKDSRFLNDVDPITQSRVRTDFGHLKLTFSRTEDKNPSPDLNIANVKAGDGNMTNDPLLNSKPTKAIQVHTQKKLQERNEREEIHFMGTNENGSFKNQNMNSGDYEEDGLLQSHWEASGSASYADVDSRNDGESKDNNLFLQADTIKADIKQQHFLAKSSDVRTLTTQNTTINTEFRDLNLHTNSALGYEKLQEKNSSDVTRSHSNKSDTFYNGVVLRRGFVKLPLAARNDGSQSLEEYIDEI